MNDCNESAICETWLLISGAYEDFAKSKGISYTAMFILYMLYYEKDCTQKKLCQKTFLPKQTVHSVITSFYKDGFVRMEELSDDRRNKKIILTETGLKYSQQIVKQIDEAEKQALNTISVDEVEILAKLLHDYTNGLISALEKKKSE